MKVQFRQTEDTQATPVAIEVKRKGTSLTVSLAGATHHVSAVQVSPGIFHLMIEGRPMRILSAAKGERRWVARGIERHELLRVDPSDTRKRDSVDEGTGLSSAMPGQVLKVLVSEGDFVEKGQAVMIIEAMKMEHELRAPYPGIVRKIVCQPGSMVAPGLQVAEIDAEEQGP